MSNVFAEKFKSKFPWPVQFIVTTHSSHLANKATFESMRYFLSTSYGEAVNLRSTRIKDLKNGLGGMPQEDRDFLHKYMTLTRCDLLFADKAILLEGTTERLMLPIIIKKVDSEQAVSLKLSNQYVSVIEVGGAYAHLFFNLLNFLELQTLIITDLDSAKKNDTNKLVACKVSEGPHTINGCIKKWFDNKDIEPNELIGKSKDEKIYGSSLFIMGSILDWPTLLNKLKENLSSAQKQVWDFLDYQSKQRINEWESDNPVDKTLKELIIDQFNGILGRSDFYKTEAFEDIEICEEGKSLYEKGLEQSGKENIQKFNRLIFESIYPHEIAKSRFYGIRRIAYQVPESGETVCGRSFEGAFILANPTLCELNVVSEQDREEKVWEMTKNIKKTDFAMKYAIEQTDWVVPRYIAEGLRWLAGDSQSIAESIVYSEIPPKQEGAHV